MADEAGKMHQKTFDIAGGDSEPLPIDSDTCERQEGGSNSLCGQWTDPEWNPEESAFYYARVPSIPPAAITRTYAIRSEEERPKSCSGDDLPLTIQERAWTPPHLGPFHRSCAMTPVFHLAMPVQNLEDTRFFYGEVLRCSGRSLRSSVGGLAVSLATNFFVESYSPVAGRNPVDGDAIGVPHFGVVLPWDSWESLAQTLRNFGLHLMWNPP